MLYDYGREYWNTVRQSLRDLDVCEKAVANAIAGPAVWKKERRGLKEEIKQLKRKVQKLVRRPGCVCGSPFVAQRTWQLSTRQSCSHTHARASMGRFM